VRALRQSLFAALVIVSVCVSSARGQPEVTGLEKSLAGKRFVLRSYSADQTAKYKWGSDGLVADPPQLFALAIFSPGSVKLKGTTVSVAGTRSILLLDGKTGQLGMSQGTPAWLTIDLGSSDPASALPKLQDALFFPDLKTAMDSLPVQFKEVLPYRLDPGDAGHPPTALKTRLFWYFDDGEWRSLPHDSPRIAEPKWLQHQTPLYPSQARQLHVQGSVIFYFVVSASGKAESLWLLKPAGYGMDDAASTAIQQSTFTPAQVDGKPVGSLLRDVTYFSIAQ